MLSREEILESLKQGKTYRQIALSNGIMPRNMTDIIKGIDPKEIEEAKKIGKDRNEEERRKIEEKRKEEKARKRGQKQQTKNGEHKQVDQTNIRIEQEEERKKEVVEKENKKSQEERIILKLLQEGKTNRQIAFSLNKMPYMIKDIINSMDSKEIEKAKEMGIRKREEQKSIYQENKNKQTNEIIRKRYDEIKEKLQNNTLTKRDINFYYMMLNKNIENIELRDIKLLVDGYIQTAQAEKAINFLDLIILKKCFSREIQDKLEELKKEILEKQKIQNVRRLIQEKNDVKEISRETGLDELTIKTIKRELEERSGQEK